MSTEQEHVIVPAIRDWLAATSDVEIPPGLSREEARRRAREFLAAIVAGTVLTDQVEMDDDLKDLLWASVEELAEKSPGQSTFEECDRFYQFVAALSVENDAFDERDEVLHRVARIGWRSAPGGLEAVLKARAAIWDHGDEQRHRAVCETADQLPALIEALTGQQVLELPELHEICARMFKLSTIRSGLVAASCSVLYTILENQRCYVGRLDDRAHLKATVALAAAIAERQRANWHSSESGYARAASAFRCTANLGDFDRVEVEYLALQLTRGRYQDVVVTAPDLIRRLAVPRERVKARLALAWAFLSLERPHDAKSVLEVALRDPAIETDPCYRAAVLTVLGNAASYLGEDSEAMARFSAAGAILAKFHYPLLLGTLTTTIGEHLGKDGHLRETLILYRAAREVFREIGQAQQLGYLNVLISEVLILLGRDEEAEEELLASLPLIERFDLRREALAATVLLRETQAGRRTDMKTIQDFRDHLRKGLL
jgi:tetratricopeptide (TPR) repeat protein